MNTSKKNSHTRTKLYVNRVPWLVRAAGATMMTACIFLTAPSVQADLLTYYNFNDGPTTGLAATPALFASDGGLQNTTITTTFPVAAAGANNTGAGTLAGSTTNQLSTDTTGAGVALALIGGTGATGTAGAGTGGNNGDYIQFTLSTTNYTNLILTYATQKTSTGFAKQDLFYSTNNGTTFTEYSAVTTVPTAFATQTFDLTGVSAVTNQASVILRLVFTGASSSTGNNRIDNLQVNASAFVAGVTPNYFGTTGTGYNASSTVFDTTTVDFNSANDGTGTAKAFDNTQVGIFGGTSGTVTVSTVTANGGIRFTSTGYVFNGGTLTLGTTPAVAVPNATDTATINTVVAGTVGLNKTGAGTLVLGGTNTYTGGTTVAGGVLSVGVDGNLGDPSSGINLGGGTLQTTANITTARSLDGSGNLAPVAGTTLTISGAVGGTTPGSVTFSDAGTVALTGTGTKSLGSLTFTTPSTLNITNAALAVSGNLTALSTTGTATINGPIALSGATHTVSVATAGAGLSLTGSLTGSGTISKSSGAGTLSLTGDNSGYTGTITLGGTTTTGGTISVGSATALGTGTLNFDTGILSNDTGSVVATAKTLSIGSTTAGSGAVLAGSGFNFTGGASLYKGSSGTAQQSLVVNSNSTISGNFTTSTGAGTSTGLTIGGTGILTLTGANTFTEPVTVSGVTVNAASTTGQAFGANPGLNVVSSGTLVLATANQVNTAAAIGLNVGTLRISASQGSGATSNVSAVTGTSTLGLGALTLTGNSTLNYSGTAATAVFASFAPGTFTLNVTGINFGTPANSADGTNNRLIFNQDVQAAGFLGDITFNGSTGATETMLDTGFYEISPIAVPEPGTVMGGLLLVGMVGWNQRRRLRGLVGHSA